MLRNLLKLACLATFLFSLGLAVPLPVSANNQGGNNGDGNGESNSSDKNPKPLHITKKVLNKADIKRIDQAFKDGRKVSIDLPGITGVPISSHFWDIFMPYEPKLLRAMLNLFLQEDNKDLKSLLKVRRGLKAIVKKIETKLKLAKKFGTPAQISIVERMLSWTESNLRDIETRIRVLGN